MKISIILICGLICWGAQVCAQPSVPASLDELLTQVRKAKHAEETGNDVREQHFLEERDLQADQLRQAREAYAAEQQLNQNLEQTLEDNAERIALLEAKLQQRSGSLLELFGVVRQVAGDTVATLEDSLVSTQIDGRIDAIQALAGSDSLPSIDRLEALWFAMQEEMTESGKVVSYPSQVIGVDGHERQRRVIRVGVFNTVSEGRYLRHLPESGKLQELPRQPARRFQEMAASLQASTGGLQPMVVDPSRGAVLNLLMQTPDLMERIQQGKLVGYVIIVIGLVGVLIALERGLHLSDRSTHA